MRNYLELLDGILHHGDMNPNRTKTDAISVFGTRLAFDLREAYPLMTTKKVFFRGVIEELLWILRGETNIKSLVDKGVHIWDKWADKDGNLGPVYGAQWRDFNGVDQLEVLVRGMRNNPRSRRHIVSGWNPEFLPDESMSPQENVADGKMALAPCHLLLQTYITTDRADERFLHMQVYQRSCDAVLGAPFNIASYAALAHILAHVVGVEPGVLVMVFGDTHIYENHLDGIKEQLTHEPRPLPTLRFEPKEPFDGDICEFVKHLTFDDFILDGYDPYPSIDMGGVAV